MRMPKHKIKNLIKPEDFARAAEKAVTLAATKPGKGGEKRNAAVKALAKWLDDQIKLPWFLELVDGPAFYIVAMILAPHVEAAYQKVFKVAPAADPCADCKEALAELKIERDQYRDQLAVVEGRLQEALAKGKAKKTAPVAPEAPVASPAVEPSADPSDAPAPATDPAEPIEGAE